MCAEPGCGKPAKQYGRCAQHAAELFERAWDYSTDAVRDMPPTEGG
ncbi:hypothetical protein AB1K54_10470 [Microbacterium sp. BWT-B31]